MIDGQKRSFLKFQDVRAFLDSVLDEDIHTKRVDLLWCTEAEEHGFLPWFVDLQAARTDSGRSSIRLRTVTAIRVSWAGRVCERKVSPMMRLYRLIVPSTPALVL